MKSSFGLLVITAFLLSACSVKTASQSPSSSSPSAAPTSKPLAQSLKDLLASGVAQKCTWESTANNETVSGEIIIQGKKFKQTSKITTSRGTQNTYGISDGEFIYSWSDDSNGNGIKMKLPSKTPTPSGPTSAPSTDQSSPVDLNSKNDYHCSPATLSPSDLTLPANIKFTDLSEMQKQFQTLPQGTDFSKYAPNQLPQQ